MPNIEEIRMLDEVPIQVNFVDKDGNPQPIDDATVKEIWVDKPDGTPLKWTASFLTDGSEGSIVYMLTTAEADTEGQWEVQGHAEGPGYKYTTKKGTFYVGEIIDVSGL